MGAILVTSLSNPQVKYIRRLLKRRFREKERKFIVEGNLGVAEALNSKWLLDRLVCTPEWKKSKAGKEILNLADQMNLGRLEVDETVFNKLVDVDTPQGVLAVALCKGYELSRLLAELPSLVLLVDAIQDPGNLGTIIRSADALGVNFIILTKGTVDLYNPKTVRATMGSLFHLPVIIISEIKTTLEMLNRAGMQLLAGMPGADLSIACCDLTRPTVLAVGNESRGCSNEILVQADRVASIPMPGRAESLNVAVATSIMLYEAVRQRNM